MAVEMRGAAFLSFFEGIEELRDRATADAVKKALRPELRERLGGLTRVGWYPLADYCELHDALDRVVNGGPEFAAQLGRVTTDRDTRGLIRYVLAFASPEMLLRYASKVFFTYVRGPSIRVEPVGPQHYRLHWIDFHGATFALHAEWQGGGELLLERCGGKEAHVTLQPGSDVSCPTFDVRWK
ncbi:MAG: DUF2378 family protein [Sandaracinaceae bacterium]|nr:DUF2378 family protein [Sandaracinaceae bacterium]